MWLKRSSLSPNFYAFMKICYGVWYYAGSPCVMCRMYLKWLDTIQECAPHTKTKKKRLYKHNVQKLVIFDFDGKLHTKISAPTMQYCTYNWHNTCTVHVPNWITVVFLLFLKSQFTTNVQNIVLLNQCMHGYIWEWTVALSCRSRGCCLWFSLAYKKQCWAVSLFEVAAKYTRFVKYNDR